MGFDTRHSIASELAEAIEEEKKTAQEHTYQVKNHGLFAPSTRQAARIHLEATKYRKQCEDALLSWQAGEDPSEYR